MNKKTTRLSSIALALMMVLMVALTLVPVGAALADSAEVSIGAAASNSADDSLNIVERKDQTVPITINKYFRNDNRSYSKLTLQVMDPDNKPILTTAATLTASGDTFTYSYKVKSTDTTGLYTLLLTRIFTDGTYEWAETDPLEVGAFWLYEQAPVSHYAATLTKNGTDDKWVEGTSTVKNYATKGAKPQVSVSISTNAQDATAKYSVRLIDPSNGAIIKSKDQNWTSTGAIKAAFTNEAIEVPENANDGDVYKYGALLIRTATVTASTPKSSGYCYYIPANNAASSSNEITIDTAGPVVGDIKISNDDYYLTEQDGFMFANTGTAASKQYNGNYVEVKSITDKGVDVDLTAAASKSYVRFVNLTNSNHKFGSASASLLIANASGPLYGTGSGGAEWNLDFTAVTAKPELALVNGQWKMEIVAVDKLGNETVKEYGKVIVYQTYTPIITMRIEAQNVIEMHVGQKLTLAELELRGVDVTVNSGASFADAWNWMIAANANGIVNYDAEAGTLNAIKAGEGRITATPISLYGETFTNLIATDYITIKVTATPSVTSLKLSSSGMDMNIGDTRQLTATVDPSDVVAEWASKDTSIATVDANGNVTAKKEGTVLITATAGSLVETCTVNVKSSGEVTVTGISLNKTAMSLTAGASETLFATTTPAGGAISWNTSDASVATVDNAGKVTAQKAGTATITATSGSYSATCVVTVTGTPETLEPNQWYQDDAGNIYYSNEHSQLTVGWKKIGGYWYLFDYSTAVMKKGWAKDAGTWYYLQSDGKMKTGWLKDGSTWYYLQASGAMKTGWLKDGGVWYYLKDSGAMATGWVKVSGIWYYLQGSGAMKEGWLLESGVWYYLTPSSGAMLANGTYTVEGRNSQFAASGRWLGYV